MDSLFSLVGLAIGLFATTNIDDVFVLLGFFSDPKYKVRQIFLGQYIGITALYLASAIASLISLVVQPAYVGLLGFVPIALGLIKIWQWRKGVMKDEAEGKSTSGHGNVAAVAAVTIANGADNVSIYTPLFAMRTTAEIATIGAIFMVMTLIWILVAKWLTHHRTIGVPIRRYGHRLVPFVLIGLGVLILHETGTIEMLQSSIKPAQSAA